jgi:hypothetical protein
MPPLFRVTALLSGIRVITKKDLPRLRFIGVEEAGSEVP